MTEESREIAETGRVKAEAKREEAIKSTQRARSAFAYSTIIVLIATFVMALFNIGVVIYFNKKWCSVIVVMDDTLTATPPTTPAGVRLAEGIKSIRKDFFC
jgi:hypothetical protein